jgi:hypothetical protein
MIFGDPKDADDKPQEPTPKEDDGDKGEGKFDPNDH